MDGYETFEFIKDIYDAINIKVPVVACSGYNNEEEKNKALKSGMSDYLEKPLKRIEVYKTLDKYL